jgi:lipoprotein signal peptidase
MFVWVIGLILAIVRWRKSPRKSILVLIGLSIMLLGGITDILQNYITANIHHMMNYIGLVHIFSIAGVLLDTLGWVLCIIAIFMEDKKENEIK